MSQEIEILRQYEQSDFHKRLCLFLQHRDLRSVFQEIERSNFIAQTVSTYSIKQHSKEEKDILGYRCSPVRSSK
jgi:hypothetical protein